MAPTSSKKARAKKAQQPVSTSIISQPPVQDQSNPALLSAFSPDASLFALVSLSVDKHRLRVYNTTSAQAIAEHVFSSARVSSLIWSPFDLKNASPDVQESQPSKKKRKKRDSIPSADSVKSDYSSVLVLGLSDGTISIFSPTHGKIIRTLTHSTSTSPILAISYPPSDHPPTLWSSSADGVVRLWDLQQNVFLRSWKSDDHIPYTAVACRPSPMPFDDQSADLLLAHHQIRFVSTRMDAVDMKPISLASFTGHASSIKSLRWGASVVPSTRFVSMAENDRCLYLWNVGSSATTAERPVASIPLDSDAREFALSEKEMLATLSSSGKISIFSLPQQSNAPVQSQAKVSTLSPDSTLAASAKDVASNTQVISIAFASEAAGSIRVARLVKSVRPVFDIVRYLDDAGNFIQHVTLDDVQLDTLSESQTGAIQNRYNESSSLAVGSGISLGQGEEVDDIRDVEGELEVDLAEMTLGQRLAAMSSTDAPRISDSEDESGTNKTKSSKKKVQKELNVAPANSLTRILIQALHSSDAKLLETCLAHSDPTLIHNTVRLLPPQLAIPLITACVERLSRGARAGNMKGRGGGASAQRGTGLITWVKAVLIIHAGHLMAIPDLVARLAGLHATLTSRLSLHESLLSLNGRLDMVLSQIEMRASSAPSTLAPKQKKSVSTSEGKEVKHYVEGESESSEEEDMQVDGVDIESGDDEGSIEDIELGGDNDEEDDDDDVDDEEDNSDEEGSLNGFIDDEAEEYSGEDDDDDEGSE